MAKLETPLSFTGSLGDLSAYTMRGVDKIVLRRKGGATRNKIRTHPNFDLTRRINAEFGGRAQCSKFIMRALRPLKSLGDYNIAGPLNSMLSRIQKMDMVNALGERDVALSKNPTLLEGFSLNRNLPFDSVVRTALRCDLSRDRHSAELEIPALVPDINLFTPKSHPYFSIMLTLGVVPDVRYTKYGYAASVQDQYTTLQQTVTPWYTARDGSPADTLRIVLSSPIPADQSFSLLAAVGIRYGSPTGDQITQIRYSGSAKICGVA